MIRNSLNKSNLNQDGNYAYVDTLSNSHKNLIRLLELVDYGRSYHFYGIRSELWPAINDALQRIDVEIEFSSSSLLYCLPKNEALKFDVRWERIEIFFILSS